MCALRLTPTKLYFILTDNAAVGGVSIWCELTQVRSKNVLHIHSGNNSWLLDNLSRPHFQKCPANSLCEKNGNWYI